MQYNKIYNADSRKMRALKNECVDLVVTSPPYNLNKDYELGVSHDEWYEMMCSVISECWRVLKPAGRMCINIANTGRKPYRPLTLIVTWIALKLGFLMRGDIIWNKGNSANRSTGWGSWQMPSNPILRDFHEYILVFSKQEYGRKIPKNFQKEMGNKQFMDYTQSIWHFNAESHRKVKHPAPFPIELPKRLILFYSFPGDLVLDPFMGSGTTALAALETGRKYVGFEKNAAYCRLANERIAAKFTKTA